MENQEKNNIEEMPTESNVPNVSVEETAKKVREKRENSKKLRILLFSIIGATIVLIGLFLVFSHFSGLKSYVYNEEYSLYQYFSGVKISYSGKVTLTNEGEITTVESDSGIDDIKDAPIYFEENNNEVLISRSMQLLIPRLINTNQKLKYFTKIIYDESSETVYFEQGKNKIYLENSFLYDGDNLYLFLMNVSLKVADKTYELSPLSYAIVNYKGQVEIYDKKNDKYEVIDLCETDVIGTYEDYVINLSTDMISYGESSRLLIKSVDSLDMYKRGE